MLNMLNYMLNSSLFEEKRYLRENAERACGVHSHLFANSYTK